MPKKVTLTNPETQASITEHRIVGFEVRPGGQTSCVVQKYDSNGAVVGSYRVEVEAPVAALDTFTQALLTQAQTDGKIPEGTISDA